MTPIGQGLGANPAPPFARLMTAMMTTPGTVARPGTSRTKLETPVASPSALGLVFVAAVLTFLLLAAIVTQYGGEEAARIWNWSDVAF
jgi:hypothetical protein